MNQPVNYQRSQVVMIYEDPVTQTKPEGEAVLLRKVSEDEYSERWIVRFTNSSEDFSPCNVERIISRYPETK